MKNKYFYPIFKLKAKSWIRYWLLKKTEFKGKLSEILEGFSFTLNNSLARKFKIFEILGNSVQDGEPSPEHEQPIKSAGENVNLFDINSERNDVNATSSVLKDELTLVSNNNWSYTEYELNTKIGQEYMISGVFSNPNNSTTKVFILDNQGNIGGPTSSTSSTGSFEYSFTAREQKTKVRFYANYSGTSNQSTVIYKKIKLEPGTKATPYSPYGMGSITDKIVNRNFCDNEWEQGFINNTTGQNEVASTSVRLKNYIRILPNVELYISRTIASSYNGYRFYDINKNYLGSNVTIDMTSSLTTKNMQANNYNQVITVNNSKVAYMRISELSNDLNTKYLIQFNSNTDKTYIAHEEQTYSIYTQQPMRSIGDVRDVFFKNTVDSPYYDENLVENGWYERHYIGYVVLNGTETYTTMGWVGGRFGARVSINNLKKTTDTLEESNIKSNYYNTYNQNDLYRLTVPNFGISNRANQSEVIIRNDNFSDISDLQTWLSNNNTELIYVLTTPTDLLCTTEQTNILENIPSTFSGQTNVFSIDEVKAYLKIQYWESDTND